MRDKRILNKILSLILLGVMVQIGFAVLSYIVITSTLLGSAEGKSGIKWDW